MQEDNLIGITDDQGMQVKIALKTHEFLEDYTIMLLFGDDSLRGDSHRFRGKDASAISLR